MTGYDVQLHLRCRNSIVTHECYRLILTPRMSRIFLEKNNLILQKKESGVDKVVNFKDFLNDLIKKGSTLHPKLDSRTFQDD